MVLHNWCHFHLLALFGATFYRTSMTTPAHPKAGKAAGNRLASAALQVSCSSSNSCKEGTCHHFSHAFLLQISAELMTDCSATQAWENPMENQVTQKKIRTSRAWVLGLAVAGPGAQWQIAILVRSWAERKSLRSGWIQNQPNLRSEVSSCLLHAFTLANWTMCEKCENV